MYKLDVFVPTEYAAWRAVSLHATTNLVVIISVTIIYTVPCLLPPIPSDVVYVHPRTYLANYDRRRSLATAWINILQLQRTTEPNRTKIPVCMHIVPYSIIDSQLATCFRVIHSSVDLCYLLLLLNTGEKVLRRGAK